MNWRVRVSNKKFKSSKDLGSKYKYLHEIDVGDNLYIVNMGLGFINTKKVTSIEDDNVFRNFLFLNGRCGYNVHKKNLHKKQCTYRNIKIVTSMVAARAILKNRRV
jgi:hypothetical protein